MIWKDLREFLTRLDELGELKTIRGASWQEEIGGITELVTERGGMALLFDDIPGYPSGFRVAANLVSSVKRTAVALGLPTDSLERTAERWRNIIQDLTPIPPEVLETGPILENVMQGDEVDLFMFPTPKWHEDDGGRYIGTGVCVIQRDPDTGVVNSGSYRVSIHNRKTCAIFIERDKDGDVIRRKFWNRGEKCPVVISVGQEPILTSLGGPSIYHTPRGVSELDVAGYLNGAPYQVVTGRVTGLPIPANGEIAIEGFIPSPSEAMVPEGPFGEWTGYYAHGQRPETIVEVAAVYHRNDPIIYGLPPLRPIVPHGVNLGGDDIPSKLRLEKAGVAGVKRVFNLATPNFKVVSVQQTYAGQADEIVRALLPSEQSYYGHQMWVLVDEDIDASNPHEVLWAIASRCAPEIGVTVVPGTAYWQLDPRIRPDDRSDPDQNEGRKHYTAHHLVINALRPFEWKDDFPPVCTNSPELRQRILTQWRDVFE